MFAGAIRHIHIAGGVGGNASDLDICAKAELACRIERGARAESDSSESQVGCVAEGTVDGERCGARAWNCRCKAGSKQTVGRVVSVGGACGCSQ